MQIQSIILVVKINTQILEYTSRFHKYILDLQNNFTRFNTFPMIMTNFYDTLSYLNSKSPLSFTERCWRSPRRTQEARTIAREPFHSIADVRLWWRNATTRFAIHHRAVMSHAVYPVKWIQSTLGGDVTDERRGGTETQRYKMKQRERERERAIRGMRIADRREHRLHKRVA